MSIHKKLNFDGRYEAMTGTLAPTASSSLESMEFNCSNSNVHSGYFDEVLSNLGIQLSPGGSSIVEILGDYDASKDPNIDENFVEVSSKDDPRDVLASHGRVKNLIRRKSTNDIEAPLFIDEEARTPESSSCGAARRPTKVRMYEICHPFEDSDKERKRRGAINAKRNREEKKRLIADLRKQINSLTHINSQCCKALLKTNTDIQRLQGIVNELDKNKKILEGELKCKAREIRECEERQMLLRCNLELIADTLEDDNQVKRLITALVERL